MSSWLDVALLAVLIVLNGVFAMSEISLVTSRRARLQRLIDDKVAGAERARELNADPNRALSTIQVGITSIGILSGIVGESALARPMEAFLVMVGLSPETAKAIGLFVVVVLITYFSIVMGELVPKRIGQISPERIACRLAPPIHCLSIIAAPFVKLLSASTHLLLKRLGISETQGSSVTEEEIHAMIEEGQESGVIETAERDMVRNVFRLDDRQVASLMTPRSNISWIDLEAPDEENIELIRTSKRSRLPVCVGSLDNVKGVCSTKMLLQQILDSGKPDFANNLMPVSYVPESLTGIELLEHFRKTDVPLELVVDEYGEVLGLVTPRDVLEAIAGEFKPEQPDDSWATRREDGSWLLDGIIPIPEMKDVLSLKHVPEEEAGRYSTLAGMVMLLLGRLPKEGDAVEWLGWRFEIVDMDGRRVDKVLASRLRAAHGMAEVVPKGEEPSPQIERVVVDNPHDGADSKTIKPVDKSVGN
ncbi:MAG: hemolysin family protein [Sutterella wadsworthensis]